MKRVELIEAFDTATCDRIDAFVADCHGSIFHTSSWLQAVQEGTGQLAMGLAVSDGASVTGWLPLHCVHSPMFGRALVSAGFAVDGGILARDPHTVSLLAEGAMELAERSAVGSIELKGGAGPAGWLTDTTTYSGFETELASTDEDQLTQIPRKARAEVRKGLKANLSIEHGRDERLRAEHYAVYARSVQNLGTPVFPRALFEAVLNRLKDAEITVVRDERGPVSAVLSFYHNGSVMPYWGGGLVRARGLHANERMYFELMCHARRQGARRFDFGRSKTGTGPYRFKKNWGFTPRPLSYASWTAPGAQSRSTNPDDPSYARRIAIWKRLPSWLADAVGPHIARGLG